MSTPAPESRRFVLALHDAGGTVPPMMAIARALVDRGHTVTVLGQPSVELPALDAGCAFVSFSAPDYATDRPIEDQIELAVELMAGKRPGDELLRTLAVVDADAVVVDANLAGVSAAAEASDLPSAVLFHSLYATYVDTWFGELWPFVAPAINETRVAFGVAAADSWTDTFLPHQRRYAVVPEVFDAPTSLGGPPPVQHFGFLVPASADATDDVDAGETVDLRPEHGRSVLISLSTTDLGQAPLLQCILDAVDGLPVHARLTTGRQVFPATLRVPANVQVEGHVPHATVLPHVDAVVTHAGMGTVSAALSHGLPLLCTPISRDQPLNAGRVADLGAGLAVPADGATPERVRAALEQVLAVPSFRQAAGELAEASRQAGGAPALAADLEQLAR